MIIASPGSEHHRRDPGKPPPDCAYRVVEPQLRRTAEGRAPAVPIRRLPGNSAGREDATFIAHTGELENDAGAWDRLLGGPRRRGRLRRYPVCALLHHRPVRSSISLLPTPSPAAPSPADRISRCRPPTSVEQSPTEPAALPRLLHLDRCHEGRGACCARRTSRTLDGTWLRRTLRDVPRGDGLDASQDPESAEPDSQTSPHHRSVKEPGSDARHLMSRL